MVALAPVEDAIVAQLAAAFGNRVKEVDHRPDRLDADGLNRLLSMAPAVYVAFLGLRRRARPDGWDADFGIYCVAANASGEHARRRGDAATIGGYEMVEVALRCLDGWSPQAAGEIEIGTAEQLQSEVFDRVGRTVYGLVATLAVDLPRGFDPTTDPTITPFVTFDAAWDVPPHGNVAPPPPPPPDSGLGRRDAGDRITLPQS